MYYTIASLSDVHNNQEFDFNKNGNRYTIGIRGEDGTYKTKTFDNMRIAHEVFQKLTYAVLTGCYSFEQRVQILNGEI